MNKKESWIVDNKYFNCHLNDALLTEEGKCKKADMQQEN